MRAVGWRRGRAQRFSPQNRQLVHWPGGVGRLAQRRRACRHGPASQRWPRQPLVRLPRRAALVAATAALPGMGTHRRHVVISQMHHRAAHPAAQALAAAPQDGLHRAAHCTKGVGGCAGGRKSRVSRIRGPREDAAPPVKLHSMPPSPRTSARPAPAGRLAPRAPRGADCTRCRPCPVF